MLAGQAKPSNAKIFGAFLIGLYLSVGNIESSMCQNTGLQFDTGIETMSNEAKT